MNDSGVRADGIDSEREFFASEFRRRTLVLALRSDSGFTDADQATSVATIRHLLDGECRLVLCVSSTGVPSAENFSCALEIVSHSPPGSAAALAELWVEVEDRGVALVEVDGDPLSTAADLAVRLGVSKLVLTDAEGGMGTSFGSEIDLSNGRERRHGVADAVRRALAGGVDGVNLCRLEDLDAELFTFNGAGTLFTRGRYVQIDQLVADDLPVVEGLVQRGVAEGFLRPRDRFEVVRLALEGLAARVRPSGHIAGIGTLDLERYRVLGLSEVACLYTITRFTGEGVGGDLIEALVAQARDHGRGAVFACTVSERAADLFVRTGFEEVALDRLPAEKWQGYDPARRRRVRALWRDLGDPSDGNVREGLT